MSLPCKINPLGVYRLPDGYLPARFLESTGAQYIHTGIRPFTGEEKCTVGMEIDGLVTGPGSATTCMIAGCGASGSTWFSPYRWWNEESAYTAFYLQQNAYPVSSPYNNRIRCSLNFLESGVVKYSANGGDAKTVSITHEAKDLNRYILLFGGDQKGDPRAATRIWSAKISDGAALVRAYVPAISPAGAPCMYDRVQKTKIGNSGDGEFTVGMTVEQARKLGKLPADAPTKTLTVSLPQSAFVDLETGEIADAAVNAALALAEAKGWVITKQYYTE